MRKAARIVKLIITGAAVLVAAAHMIWPTIRIDAITVTLLGIAVVPWLGRLFRAIELPGGLKVEYRELLEAERKAEDAGLLSSAAEKRTQSRHIYAFESVAGEDANLALAGLRIELESRLRELAKARSIPIETKSIRQLIYELTARGVLSSKEASAIHDLLPILNRAAHGASVDERGKAWVLEIGTRLLDTLDDKKGELTMPALLERWRKRDGAGVREVGEELSKAFVTSPQAFVRAIRMDPEGFAAWLQSLQQNTFTIYHSHGELEDDLWTAYYEKLKSLMLQAALGLRDSEFGEQAHQIVTALEATRVQRIW